MSDRDLAAHAPLVDFPPGATRQRDAGTTGRWAIHLGHLVYTHNPFYVISVWLVFSGLRASFPMSSSTINVWALTLCLMGYTVLLGLTAILVIRLGKVWDDARSLLLLIVLMFLGISVTFDRILAASPEQASRYYLFGWLFAATTSELLLHSLKLRLGFLFRAPYHFILVLLFLYPLVLAARVGKPDDPLLAWQLFGFSSIAALIFLCLIPAVRRGPAYVADKGIPWQWPWFPWVLFGMLGLCVSFRAYSLCVSLHFVGASNSIFAPYFLVPLVLAGILLLFEAGLAAGSQRVVRWALCLPLSVVLLASIGHDSGSVYQSFLTLFEQKFGATPLVVTLWLVVGFYLLAAVRGVAEANYPLIVTLVFVSLMPARFRGTGVDALPLAMAGVWQIAMGWRLRRSGDVVAGWCLSLASAVVGGQGTWFAVSHGILPVHMLLGILLSAGYWYQDRSGRYARRAVVALAVILASIAALSDPPFLREVPDWARILYPLFMAALLAGYSHATRDVWSYAAAAAAVAVSFLDYSTRLYAYLSHRVEGLNELGWGALFFLLAVLISLLKAGLRPASSRRK